MTYVAVKKLSGAMASLGEGGAIRGMLGNLKDRVLGRNQMHGPELPPGGLPGAPGGAPPIPEPPAPDTTSRWESFTEGIKQLGEAVQGTWKEMLAFGAAILMIGGGIAIAALGLSKLVESFQDLAGGQIVGAVLAIGLVMGGFVAILYAMIPAITALGIAGGAVAGPLIALGFALLLMGGGVALAALGMAQLVKSFKGLNGKELIAAGIGLGIFSAAVYFLVGAAVAATAAGWALVATAVLLAGLGVAAVLLGFGINLAAKGMVLFMNAVMMIPPDKMMELAVAVGMLGGAMLTLAGGLLLASIGFVAIAGALFIALPMIALSIIPLFLWSFALKAVGGALMVIGVGIGLLAANMLLIPPGFVVNLGAAFGILGLNLAKLTGVLFMAGAGFGVFALSLLFAAPILGFAAIPIAALGMALMILGAGLLLVGSGMDAMAASMSIMAEGLPGLVLLGAALGDMAKGLALFSGALLLLNVKKLQALAEFNNSLITPEVVKEGTFAAKPAGEGTVATTGAPGATGAAMGGTTAGGAAKSGQPIIKIYLGDEPIENIVKKVIEELPIGAYAAK